MLDYWNRTALVVSEPNGAFSARSLSLAVVLGRAARLGAAGPVLAQIAGRLTGPVADWPEDLWLTELDVHDSDVAAASIVIHVHRALAQAGPMLLHALSAA